MRAFKSLAAGRGRTRVTIDLFRIGPDLLAVLGGEGAHIGAVSMAEAVPRAGDRVATVSARGHREAELTDYLAGAISTTTGLRTVVVAGIHLDHITREEIETIRCNVRQLARSLGLG